MSFECDVAVTILGKHVRYSLISGNTLKLPCILGVGWTQKYQADTKLAVMKLALHSMKQINITVIKLRKDTFEKLDKRTTYLCIAATLLNNA